MQQDDGAAPSPAREWWAFVPEEERALYRQAGFSRAQRLEGLPGLLVIDVTHDFTGTRSMPVGEAIAEFPTSCGEHAWQALPQVRRLLDFFRERGLPIVFTNRDVAAQQATTGATKRAATAAEGNGFAAMVQPRPGEWICQKARASAFYGTSLDAYFRVKQVQSLIVCGGSTSGCVRASAVDAFSAGFQVIVAEDACFDRARTPHLANLFDLHAKYATVLTSDEILAALRSRNI